MENNPDAITREDIQHADLLRRQSEIADVELYIAIMGGAPVPPDVDIQSVLSRVEEIERNLPSDFRVGVQYLKYLAGCVWRRSRMHRALAERAGTGHWRLAAVHAWLGLFLLAVRVLGGSHLVSLGRLQSILHYIHS